MLTSSHFPDERRSYISGILAVAATAIFLVLSITVPAGGVPVKHDVKNKSLPLELLPPLRNSDPDGNATRKDSYGNALETLQPINTADGRKIINVHGIEFPIPKYASGITSITRPSAELLPPPAEPIIVAMSIDDKRTDGITTDSSDDHFWNGKRPSPPIIENNRYQQQREQEQEQETAPSPNIINAAAVESPVYIHDDDDNGTTSAAATSATSATSAATSAATTTEDDADAVLMPVTLADLSMQLLPPYADDDDDDDGGDTFIISAENYTPRSVAGIVDPQTKNIKVTLSTTRSVNTVNERRYDDERGGAATQQLARQQPHSGGRDGDFRAVDGSRRAAVAAPPRVRIQPITDREAAKPTTIPATTTIETTTTTTTSFFGQQRGSDEESSPPAFALPFLATDLTPPDLPAATPTSDDKHANRTLAFDLEPPYEFFIDHNNNSGDDNDHDVGDPLNESNTRTTATATATAINWKTAPQHQAASTHSSGQWVLVNAATSPQSATFISSAMSRSHDITQSSSTSPSSPSPSLSSAPSLSLSPSPSSAPPSLSSSPSLSPSSTPPSPSPSPSPLSPAATPPPFTDHPPLFRRQHHDGTTPSALKYYDHTTHRPERLPSHIRTASTTSFLREDIITTSGDGDTTFSLFESPAPDSTTTLRPSPLWLDGDDDHDDTSFAPPLPSSVHFMDGDEVRTLQTENFLLATNFQAPAITHDDHDYALETETTFSPLSVDIVGPHHLVAASSVSSASLGRSFNESNSEKRKTVTPPSRIFLPPLWTGDDDDRTHHYDHHHLHHHQSTTTADDGQGDSQQRSSHRDFTVSLPSSERSFASPSTSASTSASTFASTFNSGNPREVRVKLYPNNVFLNEAIKNLAANKDFVEAASSMNGKVTVSPYGGGYTSTAGISGDVRRTGYGAEVTQRPPTASPQPLPRPTTRTAAIARIDHGDFGGPPGIFTPYDTVASKVPTKF